MLPLLILTYVGFISLGLPDAVLDVVYDPIGKHVFTLNLDYSISLFTADASGKLTAMTPPNLANADGLLGGSFDPTGQYFYAVSNTAKKIFVWSVGATTITPITTATITFAGDVVPIGITTTAP